MIKFAVFGALGYIGYRYLQKGAQQQSAGSDRGALDVVAGGPLSDQATVQHSAELPAR